MSDPDIQPDPSLAERERIMRWFRHEHERRLRREHLIATITLWALMLTVGIMVALLIQIWSNLK